MRYAYRNGTEMREMLPLWKLVQAERLLVGVHAVQCRRAVSATALNPGKCCRCGGELWGLGAFAVRSVSERESLPL